tara:strand:- start:6665 stop:9643 length:2979 start_codon:yes stop_codon:yes gene_type:complete
MNKTHHKVYNPSVIEKKWCYEWESRSLYSLSNRDDADCEAFSIQLPPPNVTGTLHMGHAFNQTLMDILVRWNRMLGKKTIWIPGTDHAGIATQLVVERNLETKGLSKEELGRDNFIAKVWEWKKLSGDTITNQMRRLGSSCDWNSEYFTMDTTRSKIVQEAFVILFNQGLVYRGSRLVNWDPVLMTAISDLEVVTEETDGFLWTIKYPLVDVEGSIKSTDRESVSIATTRPETLLGDVAVAVNPEDKRYTNLIGSMVKVPIVNRIVPIIADDTVDKGFGTGCVKITPAHDFNDYEVGKRHALESINILTKDGKINENAPAKFVGCDRFVARETILEELSRYGFLISQKKHRLALKKGDRSGTVIEPMLTKQWFIDVNKEAPKGTPCAGKSLAEQGLEALLSGSIRFVPDGWKNTYKSWFEELQDWCISRQLWWGHQIPAWYKVDSKGHIIEAEKVYVAVSLAGAKELAKKDGWDGELVQETDVLDTWFSSALVPFSTLMDEDFFWNKKNGSPKLNKDMECFLPSSVLVTGFDIIFFWVARMVMMTRHFTGKIPFKDIYIHALVRDAEGNKMSKSKGNTLDPLDIIDGISLTGLLEKRCKGLLTKKDEKIVRERTEKEFPNGINAYGVDALRFTFASMASPGRNINFDLSRCEGYRNFCNKLWNAYRFILMQCEREDNGLGLCGGDCGIDGNLFFSRFDRWIVSRQNLLFKKVSDNLSSHRFDLAAKELYEFVWNDFCDWYLEICKTQLNTDKDNLKRATRRSMLRVFESSLRLLHPFLPFLTEEIWQSVGKLAGKSKKLDCNEEDSIMSKSFPLEDESKIDESSLAYMTDFQDIVISIRTLRSEMQLSPSERPEAIFVVKKNIPLIAYTKEDQETNLFSEKLSFDCIRNLAKLRLIHVVEDFPDDMNHVPFQVCGDIKILLKVKIDKDLEINRLQKEIDKLNLDLVKVEEKLSNKSFVDKAPEKIVNIQKEKRIEYLAKISELSERVEIINR